ncbi:DeoR family transcriptional regulator, partial [Phytoactinopolyspora mesophila]|nr:DeoR family transcriptional regulator [Phytoactinopolyspora mesophila]
MLRATRRRSARITSIVEQLVAGAEVSVRSLAREFRVSAATIRRDLVLLEQQGILSRTHGGAVSSDEFAAPPLPYRAEHTEAKARIAVRAAASIPALHNRGCSGRRWASAVRRCPDRGRGLPMMEVPTPPIWKTST